MPADVPPAWKIEIDNYLTRDLTHFERDALSDYKISDQEVSQAEDLFRECAHDVDPDYVVTFGADGSTQVGPKEGQPNAFEGDAEFEHQDKILACEQGTTAIVFSVRQGMATNPENLGFAELVRRCFKARNVPDGAELSDADFAEMVLPPDGESIYEPSTPDGKSCMSDPFNTDAKNP
ncbi:hypothetical protein [Cellulomonas sp. URHB0016]